MSNQFNMPEVPCGICGVPTLMTGTKRCDGCWELETRIRRNPERAAEILAKLTGPGFREMNECANFVLFPVHPTEEMLDHFAGAPWRSLPPGKQRAELRAYDLMLAAAIRST